MDNETLIGLIIENREAGKTFQGIADELGKNGIVMSRQAVHHKYIVAKREIEKSKEGIENSKEYVIMTDIMNLDALGYFQTEIVEIINKEHAIDWSYYKVRKAVALNDKWVESIRESMVRRLSEALEYYDFYTEFKDIVRYKEWDIKDGRLKELVKEVYKARIRGKIEEELKLMLNFTDDNGLADELKEELCQPCNEVEELQYG